MRILFGLFLLFLARPVFAEEPFFKPNDVIAIVGGEDMVVANELGFLETEIQYALPEHRLKFRSLAWEGDTVFEQRRDLNYPPLEAQLEKIGATVVMAQFGQMESLAGKASLPAFVAAYERLIERMRGKMDRRLVLVAPCEWRDSRGGPAGAERMESVAAYREAIEMIAARNPGRVVFVNGAKEVALFKNSSRDGVHLAEDMHPMFANALARRLKGTLGDTPKSGTPGNAAGLRKLIVAKNRLWFHYSRPQNWAFLAGDRINQPSSRDHKDLSKRWFPAELEQFVPLIEAKEKEIWELAAKLNR